MFNPEFESRMVHQMIEIPVSPGELVDKITILELKVSHFEGTKKLSAQHELKLLASKVDKKLLEHELYLTLKGHNAILWDLESDIRAALSENKLEIVGQQLKFIHEFNAARHQTKSEIDKLCHSSISEQKDYTVK